MVLRAAGVAALTLCLLGCNGEPVGLLTGVDPNACWAGGEARFEGLLVAGGDYGITLDGKPVMWPDGFTGRRVGPEVEVLDGRGHVVATTGRWYRFAVGYISDADALARQARLGAVVASTCEGGPIPL